MMTTLCPPRHRRASLLILAASAAASLAAPALAQPLRVVTWNISNYNGGRAADLQTAIFGEFQGRTMAPDVILAQEFMSQNAVDVFLFVLNNYPGAPADWAAAPFINGPDTDSAFFYRTSRVQLLAPGVTLVATGGTSPNHPRNIQRYDVRPVGYSGPGATIAMYSSHMKAQDSGTDDDARRLLESNRIVADAAALPGGWHFLLGGDFNIQTASEGAYRALVGINPFSPTGPFFDPIIAPGSWNNSSAYRFIHTQDPSGNGGMDDRFDQLLLSGSLLNGAGFDYVGSLVHPYSNTTWDDPNHSYRCWGNDGTTFNSMIAVTGNQMVGPTIAQALRNVSTTAGGHLPVFLDLRVPARADSDLVVDFGAVAQGSGPAPGVLMVRNAGDSALWTEAGLADLHYTLQASAGFAAPGGAFSEAPGGDGNTHIITMDTSSPGVKSGTITITSDDPDVPVRTVTLTGVVEGETGCAADWNGDGAVDSGDISAFLTAWIASVQAPNLVADFNNDGATNSGDISAFLTAWLPAAGGGC